MWLWSIFALMTAGAILAVLWPLARRNTAPRSGSDLAVYRDQLDEIDRDKASGLIGESEAEAARVEVSRRLLAAADAQDAVAVVGAAGAATWRRRAVALTALLALPLGGSGFYLAVGSPSLPGQPLAARLGAPPDTKSIERLIAQVETHLENNPSDGRGWEVLAPVYLRLGRFADAVKARRSALALNGETAERQAELGEALTAAANGVVTAEAKTAFERAVVLDAGSVKGRFFLGVAAEQDGRTSDAATIWRAMIASAPADAPWTEFVRGAIARVESGPATGRGGPSSEDVEAASQLGPEQRSAMIRGMVERLAARLKDDGSDVEGWLRLVRSYMVLGDREKAMAAAQDARRALADDTDKLRRVDELVKGLGLEG
jgi:cytochrome c-type biogenesis protein CcmH